MKKHTIRMLAMLVAVVCMIACFAGCSSAPADAETPEVIEHSPEFDAVFAESSIKQVDATFDGMKSSAFVMESDDGMVECFEFGYEGDKICAYVDTVYLDVAEYSEDERSVLDESMRSAFASVEALDSVEITYGNVGDHYVIEVSVDGLDDVEVLQEVVESGVFTLTSTGDDSEVTFLSMKQTEDSLVAQGFIKR